MYTSYTSAQRQERSSPVHVTDINTVMRKIVTPVQVTHTDGEEEHYTVLRTLVMTTTDTRWHHGT